MVSGEGLGFMELAQMLPDTLVIISISCRDSSDSLKGSVATDYLHFLNAILRQILDLKSKTSW
jgi:hypothetical protein